MENTPLPPRGLTSVLLYLGPLTIPIFRHRQKGFPMAQGFHAHHMGLLFHQFACPGPPWTPRAGGTDFSFMKPNHFTLIGPQEDIHISVGDASGNEFIVISKFDTNEPSGSRSGIGH